MNFIDVYSNGKLIAKRVKNCEKFYQKVLGLMFVKSPGGGAFLPDVKDIHMNFVRFPLKIVWLDENFRVLRIVIAKPWRLYYGPYDAKHVLELPVNNKSRIKVGSKLSIKNYGNG